MELDDAGFDEPLFTDDPDLCLWFTAENLDKITEGHSTQHLIRWCRYSESYRKVLKPIIHGRGFAELPNEVFTTVIEHLLRSNLLKFARASRQIFQACQPTIYSVVDLSIHNRGRVVPDSTGMDEHIGYYSRS